VLNALTRAMKEAGLLEPSAVVTTNMVFKGDIIYLNVYGSDGTFHHVRVSTSQDLAVEFSSNLDAARRYPRLVPFPLGYGTADGAWWIAYEGVHLRPISPRQLIRATPGSPVHDGIIAYFAESQAQSGVAAMPVADFEQDRRRRAIGAEIPDTLIQRAFSLYGELGMDALPATLQHGDLAINNLATADEKLVIFDWEDFGKASVPGFDLAVLFASAHDFQPSALRIVAEQPARAIQAAPAWLIRSCAIIGIRPEVFARALPLYMLLFLQMKAPPYSQNVRDRVCAAVLAFA
jgi:hypothetical protein